MHRLAKLTTIVASGLLLASVAALAWFDVAFVAPAVSKARALLVQASTTERQPPAHLVHLLAASDRNSERSALVRRLLHLEPSQVQDLRTTQRQLAELGTSVLIGWHLSEFELTSARLASSYMGNGIVGFERAAAKYFNTPLAQLTREQLAELVALERAPTTMLENPASLKRVKQLLLDRTA
jgi:hypothetical protein